MKVFIQEQGKELNKNFEKTAVALGCFDAMHKGHRAIISDMVKSAKEKGLTPLVYFFINRPKGITEREENLYINTLEKRLEILEELGVSVAVATWFTEEYSKISPEDFINVYLKEKLDAHFISVGENYRFGHRGAGDTKLLKELGGGAGIEVSVVPYVKYGEEIVSSTLIKKFIKEGELKKANDCLERPFSVSGEVLHGKEIGRTIGFPTANMDVPDNQTMVKNGVYITEVMANGKKYPAITNVGERPTVESSDVFIESHILDFNESLYGEKIEVLFHKYLREISAFSDLTELKWQLEKDKAAAREYFK